MSGGLLSFEFGGARNRDPIHKSLGPILVLAVCVVGIGTIWGCVFRVLRSENRLKV